MNLPQISCGGQSGHHVLDPSQAPEFLGISERCFTDLRKNDPSFPRPRKIGRLPRWTCCALMRWIDSPSIDNVELEDTSVVESESIAEERSTAAKRTKNTRSETDV